MKILISAYIKENFGDDLLLETLFKNNEKNTWYIIGEDNGKNTFRQYDVQYVTLKNILFKIHEFDALIFIGGSIFMENQSWIKRYVKRSVLSLLFKLNNKKVYILGSNFGPYNSSIFKKVHKYFFKYLVTHTTFRDEKSVNEFRENINNLDQTVDLVFSIYCQENKNYKNRHYNIKENNVLGISLMNFEKNIAYDDFLITNIKNEISTGNTVKLFSFCHFEGDDLAIEKIFNRLDVNQQNNIEIIRYDGNIESFLNEFIDIDRLISTRFHATVLGLIFNIPQHPIMYSDKTLNMLSDLEYKGKYTKLKKIRNLKKLEFEDYSTVESTKLLNHKKIALKNFEIFN